MENSPISPLNPGSIYVDKWLQELGNYLLELDPQILPNPIRITQKQFAQKYRVIEPFAKRLIALIESHPLTNTRLKRLSTAYQWLNFCTEVYEAYIADPITMAMQPDFVYLEHALSGEFSNVDVDHFINLVWNQFMPNSKLSYAQCYATLCQTIGPNTKCTKSFIQDIAGDLTDKVASAVNYEYLMSYYPQQLEAYLHRSAIINYYQHYWFDKGRNPECLKSKINWLNNSLIPAVQPAP